MISVQEFCYPSSDGKTSIHAMCWLPEGEAVGVFQIVHGVAEYIARYDPFARYLAAQGFVVVGNDHLGHGQSRKENAQTLYFAEKNGWQCLVDDVYALRCRMKEQFPTLPHILMGHSMGSFVTRTYLFCYPGSVDAVILMGTGQNPAAVVNLGKLMAAAAGCFVGQEGYSPLVDRLIFGLYNQKFAPTRTDLDWLSADEANVDRYIADPLCGEKPSVNLFREMMGGLRRILRPENLDKMDKDMPVLFIAGQDDPVGQMGEGVKKAGESFRRAGVKDVTVKLYPGLRHEILNEACHEIVYQDILNWIQSRLPR